MAFVAIVGASALFVPSLGMPEATGLQRYLEHWGNEVAAAALIEAVVRPDGTIQSCDTKTTVGDAGMASDMCRWFLRHRVKSGTLGDGTRVYSVIRTITMGYEPGTAAANRVMRDRPSLASLTLWVNRLPSGVRVGQVQSAALRVEPDGKVSECEPSPGVPTALAPLICEKAREVPMPIVTNDQDQAVTYVRYFGVAFELDRAVPSN